MGWLHGREEGYRPGAWGETPKVVIHEAPPPRVELTEEELWATGFVVVHDMDGSPLVFTRGTWVGQPGGCSFAVPISAEDVAQLKEAGYAI